MSQLILNRVSTKQLLIFIVLVLRVAGQGSIPNLVNRFCNVMTNSLPVTEDCDCIGGISPTTGVNINVSCALEGVLCIPGTPLCVTPIWEGIYYRRGLPSQTLLVIDATEFFGYDKLRFTLQPLLVQFNHTVPLNAVNPIDFNSCRAAYGTTLCHKCEICSDGNGFKFDCTNINLLSNDIATINLPKINACLEIPGL